MHTTEEKMSRHAHTLTEQEQEKFTEAFYAACDNRGIAINEELDVQTSCPWGCPWTWGSDVLLSGDSIDEMAVSLLDGYEQEIRDLAV